MKCAECDGEITVVSDVSQQYLVKLKLAICRECGQITILDYGREVNLTKVFRLSVGYIDGPSGQLWMIEDRFFMAANMTDAIERAKLKGLDSFLAAHRDASYYLMHNGHVGWMALENSRVKFIEIEQIHIEGLNLAPGSGEKK